MRRAEEMSKLIKQMKPMFNRIGELTNEEMDEVGMLFAKWMELNNQSYFELQGIQNQDSEAIIDGGKIPLALFLFYVIAWNHFS